MGAARTLQALLQLLRADLPGIVHDRMELFSLEFKRAGQAIGSVTVLTAVAALCGITAWFACWVGLAVLLLALDLHWAVAVLAVILLNAGVALWALLRVRRLLPSIDLPATRRHLKLGVTTTTSDLVPLEAKAVE